MICAGLSPLCLLQTGCYALLWGSKAPPLSQLISSVRYNRISHCVESFPPYNSFPGMQVPSQFLSLCISLYLSLSFFFALLRYVESFFPFGSLKYFVSVKEMFCENNSIHRCIFNEFVREVSSTLYSSCHLDVILSSLFKTKFSLLADLVNKRC